MIQSKAEKIVARLLNNATEIKYGQVSVCLRVHSGRVVDVTFTTTESTKETEAETDRAESSKAGGEL